MPAVYPHVVMAENYAKGVVSGDIIACKWVRLACQRHLDDKKKVRSRSYLFKFDRAKAQKICTFAELIPHVKGRWARDRKTIKLEPWQAFILCVLFGWVEKSTGSGVSASKKCKEYYRCNHRLVHDG